jgi:hypothetical protein
MDMSDLDDLAQAAHRQYRPAPRRKSAVRAVLIGLSGGLAVIAIIGVVIWKLIAGDSTAEILSPVPAPPSGRTTPNPAPTLESSGQQLRRYMARAAQLEKRKAEVESERQAIIASENSSLQARIAERVANEEKRIHEFEISQRKLENSALEAQLRRDGPAASLARIEEDHQAALEQLNRRDARIHDDAADLDDAENTKIRIAEQLAKLPYLSSEEESELAELRKRIAEIQADGVVRDVPQ